MGETGPVLRRWRLAKEMRQKDVEAETGIPQAYISDLERGNIREPGFIKVGRIVKALGKTVEDLMEEVARSLPAAA